MPSRKSAAGNTRNLFANAHGINGKGDKDRTSNTRAYTENFPESMGPRSGKAVAFRRVYGQPKARPIAATKTTDECLRLPGSFEDWTRSPSFMIH